MNRTKIPKKQIAEGTRHEYEHRDTIEKIRTKKLNLRESARMIAMDHLKEDPLYYRKLQGIEKGRKMQDGGIIEGKLHSECDDRSGCGEKFSTADSSKLIEAERGEAIITGKAVKRFPTQVWEIEGTPAQVASALNFLGGGIVFTPGAKVFDQQGKKIDMPDTAAHDTTPSKHLEAYNIFINRKSMADHDTYRMRGTVRQIASAINKIHSKIDFAPGAEIQKITNPSSKQPDLNKYGPVSGLAGYGYMVDKTGKKKLMRMVWNMKGYTLITCDRNNEQTSYKPNEIKDLISNKQFVVIMAKKPGKITR